MGFHFQSYRVWCSFIAHRSSIVLKWLWKPASLKLKSKVFMHAAFVIKSLRKEFSFVELTANWVSCRFIRDSSITALVLHEVCKQLRHLFIYFHHFVINWTVVRRQRQGRSQAVVILFSQLLQARTLCVINCDITNI